MYCTSKCIVTGGQIKIIVLKKSANERKLKAHKRTDDLQGTTLLINLLVVERWTADGLVDSSQISVHLITTTGTATCIIFVILKSNISENFVKAEKKLDSHNHDVL